MGVIYDPTLDRMLFAEKGKGADMDGNEQRYDRKIYGFVASNGVVHDELLTLIQSIL